MKKTLLLLLGCTLSALAQTVVISPKFGCPNSTDNTITAAVSNNTGISIPVGVACTISLSLTENSIVIGTVDSTFTAGFANNTSRTFLFEGIDFGNPSTCTITGTISATLPILGAISYPVSENYVVKFPPTLTLTAEPDFSITIAGAGLSDYSVEMYEISDLINPVTPPFVGTTYVPTADGTYQALAVDPSNGCISENPSNQVVILNTSTQKGLDVQVSVYPNPAASELHLETEKSETFQYEMADMNGNTLLRGSFAGKTEVTLNNLPSGSLVLKVSNAQGQFNSYKIVR
ncbi:MAG: T9SS type A sorting domain-containing protein [Cytophagaceae bacterium]|jgi:hypothetical protein|nr:T9SS type A sorting domain-containing protein [Cytophagaceae bacterium]